MSKASNDSRRVLGNRLMGKECTLSTGKLPSVSMSRHNVVRINDRCDITSAVNSERTVKQQNIPAHHYVSALTAMSVQSHQCQCCHAQVYLKLLTVHRYNVLTFHVLIFYIEILNVWYKFF